MHPTPDLEVDQRPPAAFDLDAASDEELVARARQEGGAAAEAALAGLYRRYYPKVAAWCLRLAADREAAADLAQEVFLRVHERLPGFRGESRFSTWLYSVTRSVAINRGIAERRRRTETLDDESGPEPVEPAPGAEQELVRGEILTAFRRALESDLEPLEARILYLHFVDGVSLPAITRLLELENRSGAKAFIVSGGRKLKRRFGRWLAVQSPGGSAVSGETSMSQPLSLEEWLRAAWAPAPEGPAEGCPPPESFLEADLLAEEERRRLDEHADRCPACAAERDLARLFAAGPAAPGVRAEDVDYVVARLEGSAPVADGFKTAGTANVADAAGGAERSGDVVPFATTRRPASSASPVPALHTARRPGAAVSRGRWPGRLAAAAVLVLAAGLAFRTLVPPTPELPDPGVGSAGVVRGSEVETLAPAGEVPELPAELAWAPLATARSYRVRLVAVDGEVLWETRAAASPARLPAAVANRLHRAVTYKWTVEALDGEGRALATSRAVSFRARPEREDGR